jgi:uncharacterized protein involved in exopolysaccharide biosynthesis
MRRRWKTALGVAAAFVAASAAAFELMPRRYHVESRIFAMPAEGAPGALRGNNGDPAGLAPGAAEVILSDENLRQLIRDHDLVDRWRTSRTGVLRLLDRLRGADQDSDELPVLGYLRKKLIVQVKGSEVTIAFDWPEPQAAFAVVRAEQEKLIAARREAELAPLERKVESLEASAAQTQGRIDAGVLQIDAALKARRRGARAASVRSLQAEGHFRDLPDPRLVALRLQIVAQRKSIAEAEASHRSRLAEVTAKLAGLRATLGPAHPAVLDTEDELRAVERQGAQIEALQGEEQRLLAEYVRAGGKEIELSADAPPWPAEVPRKATAPDGPVFALAGAVGAILLAAFAAVAADLKGGVIRETWQAQRLLGLPVLAEVRAP